MNNTLAKLAASTMAVGVTAAVTMSTAPAQALQIFIDPIYGSTENTGASALLDLTFSDVAANQVKLDLNITNTTDGTKGLGASLATLVGIAYDGPDLPSSDLSLISYDPGTSNFTKLWLRGVNTPSLPPYGSFDGAISPERQNFAGGNANQGLKAGESASVSFLFNSIYSASVLSDGLEDAFADGDVRVAARFQQVNAGGGSDKVLGGIPDVSNPPQSVPEPSVLMALALSCGGFSFLKKKNQDKQAASN